MFMCHSSLLLAQRRHETCIAPILPSLYVSNYFLDYNELFLFGMFSLLCQYANNYNLLVHTMSCLLPKIVPKSVSVCPHTVPSPSGREGTMWDKYAQPSSDKCVVSSSGRRYCRTHRSNKSTACFCRSPICYYYYIIIIKQ